MLNDEIKSCIHKSVLCWLATSNHQNEPNVSPKEMFTNLDDETLIIAHIASPNSIQNIRENPHVCVSMVDVFVQRGFKLKGTAVIIEPTDADFDQLKLRITNLFTDAFPIKAIIKIHVKQVDVIQAPSYWLYPNITEKAQVASAMQTYGVKGIEDIKNR